ncbi:MAG: hypothetical protein U0838_04305 [Chloroflexota bacterium]
MAGQTPKPGVKARLSCASRSAAWAPSSLDDLRGLRAARWVRESTEGQYDRYGPESQHEQMDRFVERYGLVDTKIVYSVAHSGRTVALQHDGRDAGRGARQLVRPSC